MRPTVRTKIGFAVDFLPVHFLATALTEHVLIQVSFGGAEASGADVQATLAARTGVKTVPQVFINGLLF